MAPAAQAGRFRVFAVAHVDQAMALPYHLYVLSTQVPNVDEKIRYGTALVLLLLVLSLNLLAIVLRARFRRKRQW